MKNKSKSRYRRDDRTGVLFVLHVIFVFCSFVSSTEEQTKNRIKIQNFQNFAIKFQAE